MFYLTVGYQTLNKSIVLATIAHQLVSFAPKTRRDITTMKTKSLQMFIQGPIQKTSNNIENEFSEYIEPLINTGA